jgi:broad specificity phosphatase PhoE
MRIYMVRHAQTDWNQGNLAIGQSDVPLSELGVIQAVQLGERFESLPVDRIISSDLIRCRITAQAIADATGAPIEWAPQIRERSFGEWESQDYGSVNERLLALSIELGLPFSQVRAPAGESHEDVWDRVAPVLAPLFEAEGNIVLVSHGGTSRVMLALLLRATHATTFCFKFDNASLTQLDRRPDGAFLLGLYNDTSHLLPSI